MGHDKASVEMFPSRLYHQPRADQPQGHLLEFQNTLEALEYMPPKIKRKALPTTLTALEAQTFLETTENTQINSQVLLERPTSKHPRDGWPTWRWPAVALFLCLSIFMYGYDLSNIANIQAPIYQTLGHTELLPWVACAYTLMNVVFALFIRRATILSDLKLQVIGYILLTVIGSAVSGAASNMTMMIVGRCICGIGAAGLYQLALIFNTHLNDPEGAARWTSILGAVWALGLFCGPVFGGLFAQDSHATWRWAIYLNFPLAIPLLALGIIGLPSVKIAPGTSLISKLIAIDWLGFVLHFVGSVMITSCVMYSGSTWAWTSASTIAAWIVTGLLWTFYIRQQAFSYFTNPRHRYVPADLLSQRDIILGLLCTTSMALPYSYNLLYMPLFFSFTQHVSAIQSGIHILPFVGTFIFAVLFMGAMLPRFRFYTPSYVFGGILVMVGTSLQSLNEPTTPTSRILGNSAIVGFGVGLCYLLGISYMTRIVPADRAGDVFGLFITFQLGGVLIMQVVAAGVYENVGLKFLEEALGHNKLTTEEMRQLLAGADSKVLQKLSPDDVKLVVSAVTKILARLEYLGVGGAALCFFLASQMRLEKVKFGRG